MLYCCPCCFGFLHCYYSLLKVPAAEACAAAAARVLTAAAAVPPAVAPDLYWGVAKAAATSSVGLLLQLTLLDLLAQINDR